MTDPVAQTRLPAAGPNRRRPRISTSIALATITRLKERAAASGETVGREIDFAVREADAEHGRLRHAVLTDLGAVLLRCAQVRAATRHPDALEAVADIEAAVGAARVTLAKPAAASRE